MKIHVDMSEDEGEGVREREKLRRCENDMCRCEDER